MYINLKVRVHLRVKQSRIVLENISQKWIIWFVNEKYSQEQLIIVLFWSRRVPLNFSNKTSYTFFLYKNKKHNKE